VANPIEVEGLKKNYGTFPAVKGIDFGVQAGEVFGLLGRMARAKPPPSKSWRGFARAAAAA